MKKWIVAAAIVIGGVGVAFAINVGTYQGCNDCTLGSLSGPEESIFIRTVVNQDVNSWVDSNNEPNSVTLCNTSQCATYKYIPLSGMFQRSGSRFPNPIIGSCGSHAVCEPI